MAIILSPAGNMDALRSAVNNGAQAVYLGLNMFNARMKADNFDSEQLVDIVNYCHIFDVKVFVTVNTSVKQAELQQAINMLHTIYNNNADGVIVTDIALLEYCGKTFDSTHFEIIASTQLNVHDVWGAKFVESLGATTVVVSRESTIQDIVAIKKNTNIKVECFVQGAMCVCQSGQCLMSSIIGGNSGNRGMCLQPCRQHYRAYNDTQEIANGYMLSPKDLCLLQDIGQLVQIGVDAYKIEGRNRRSQYSGLTSRIYNEVVGNDYQVKPNYSQQLKSMFNRGDYMSTQYLLGNNDDIIYCKAQGHIGNNIGKIINGKLHTSVNIDKGDAFKILHDNTEIGNAVAIGSGSGIVDIAISGKYNNGDSVAITSDVSLIDDIDKAIRKLTISVAVNARVGQPLQLTAKYKDIQVNVSSQQYCAKALNCDNIQQNLAQQLQKTGNSYYTITDIVFDINDIYLPISVINSCRRALLDKLTDAIVSQYNHNLNRVTMHPSVLNIVIPARNNVNRIIAIAKNRVQLAKAIDNDSVDVVIYYCDNIAEVESIISHKPIYIDIPPFADMDIVGQVASNGIVVNNVGAIQWAKSHGVDYIVGSGLNIYNSVAADILAKEVFVYSHELTLNEISDIACDNGYTFVDGEIVVMKVVHCPFKASGYNCNNCNSVSLKYVDDRGNAFYIRRRKFGKCMFDIVNGVPLSVMSKITRAGNYVVDYDSNVVNYYSNINKGIVDNDITMPTSYTKGRLFDKVH